MARVSHGSRAGTEADYGSSSGELRCRPSTTAEAFASLEDLKAGLRREINASVESSVPECTTCELGLSREAWVPLVQPSVGPYAQGGAHDLAPGFKTNWGSTKELLGGNSKEDLQPHAAVQSILHLGHDDGRSSVQRAASRAIMLSIEAADGFKYTFNNMWQAKDDDGLRFSYICQDSMQNKDRHANGFTKTMKHLKGDVHAPRGARKPTYNCKGSVSVKFSAASNSVHIYYRHYAIHNTVAERRLPPRSNAKARLPREDAIAGVEDAAMGELQAGPNGDSDSKEAGQQEQPREKSNVGRQRKRKRHEMRPADSHVPAETVDKGSLADLIKQSENGAPKQYKQGASSEVFAKTQMSPGRGIRYDLPTFMKPPSPSLGPSLSELQQQAQPAPNQRRPHGRLNSHSQLVQPQYLPTGHVVPHQPAKSSSQQSQHPHGYHQQASGNSRSQHSSASDTSSVSRVYSSPAQATQAPTGLFTTMKPVSQMWNAKVGHGSRERKRSAQTNLRQTGCLGGVSNTIRKHPEAQGMFGTLRIVPATRKESNNADLEYRQMPWHGGLRARKSCDSCRAAKVKCDEVHPICGGCVKKGRSDCRYDAKGSVPTNLGAAGILDGGNAFDPGHSTQSGPVVYALPRTIIPSGDGDGGSGGGNPAPRPHPPRPPVQPPPEISRADSTAPLEGGR